MKISEAIVFEGLSPILYHGTNIDNAVSILKQNVFKLKQEGIAQGEIIRNTRRGGPFYFLSTARSKNSFFIGSRDVILTLDGRKMANMFQGSPVDWGSSQGDGLNHMDEMEDRVYSRSPTIPNASKYILFVEIYDMFGVGEPELEALCKSKGIPYKLYEKQNDMINSRNVRY